MRFRYSARRYDAGCRHRFQRAQHDEPIGREGVGESGTVASTATVMNAILDALAPLGVTDMPMPATPERTWRAIRERTSS
jgi:aerobic carbon-monoxide dehydrogenase large subunit